MKSNLQFDNISLDGDDRLMDALLREHARVGSHADEGFLTRLASFLDEECESPGIAISPASTVKRPSHRLAWSLGLAATVALAVMSDRVRASTPWPPAIRMVGSTRTGADS